VIRPFVLTAMVALVAAVPGPVRAGKIERIVTPAGIEIWHVRDRTLPMISVEFAFHGGAAQDPADKPGVANLVAALLDEGAGDLDARAFQEQLEERAIRLSFNARRDTLRGSLRSLSEHKDRAFELLSLAVTAPRFDAAEFERVRASALASLRRRATDPSDLAAERWFARAFPDHPYGRPVNGTQDSVAAIGAEDLRTYHTNVLARSNLRIAAVGDIEAVDLAALVDKTFGALPAEPSLQPVPEAVPQGTGAREVIDLDVPQTVITFGGFGLKRDDPDFIPAFLLNHVLGGGSFSSRLYREVREKRGLAYSVYSYLAPLRHAGLFLGGVSTRNDRATESIDLITEEVRRIAVDGLTDRELADAKSYLIGSYPLRFDTSGKIAGQLLDIQLEDLGIDYIDRRNALIEAVSDADLRRAAARLLANVDFLVVMVGRPDLGPAGGRKG
jgi:zinc protease